MLEVIKCKQCSPKTMMMVVFTLHLYLNKILWNQDILIILILSLSETHTQLQSIQHSQNKKKNIFFYLTFSKIKKYYFYLTFSTTFSTKAVLWITARHSIQTHTKSSPQMHSWQSMQAVMN